MPSNSCPLKTMLAEGNSRTYIDASKVKSERLVEQPSLSQVAPAAYAVPGRLDDGIRGSRPRILETALCGHAALGGQREAPPSGSETAEHGAAVHYEVVVQAKVLVNEVRVPVKSGVKSDSAASPAQQTAASAHNVCKFKVNQPLTFPSKKQALDYVLQFM